MYILLHPQGLFSSSDPRGSRCDHTSAYDRPSIQSMQNCTVIPSDVPVRCVTKSVSLSDDKCCALILALLHCLA